MKISFKSSIAIGCGWLCLLLFTYPATAQNQYRTYDELTQLLENLESEYSDYADLQSIGRSPGDHDIWLLSVGTGDIHSRPAVAVIGGANGAHILGSELALQFAERLLSASSSDSVQSLLESTTFYIVPRLNPDAAGQYFADTVYERKYNDKPTDTDRDGTVNEDPYEDLNDDGLITMIRVKDPTGQWKMHSGDSRVMVKADRDKAEDGSYNVYPEGRDNDMDGSFNEDGEGGINLNKNFTFDYPAFEPGAGPYMLSESENRALLDFLFETGWNVFAVFSFGPANNLSDPVSFSRSAVSKRVITGWYRQDVAVNKYVSNLYNETTGLQEAPKAAGQPGDLFQWGYFHYGRFSFSTPGWWVPKSQNSSSYKVAYLDWAEKQNIDAFVDWQPVDHPDFPGKEVEVGGIKPFKIFTPPYSAVDSLAEKHTRFLFKLADQRPQLQLVNLETESAGENLTRVTVDIYNNGNLPTASRLGERIDWVRDIKVELTLDGGSLVSGDRLTFYDSIPADGSETLSWLIRGNGSFTIRAGAPQSGFSTIDHTTK